MLRTIEAATPEGNLMIRVSFRGGETTDVDLSDLPGRGGVFAKLGDPGFFGLVTVGEHGRFLVWPDEIEICADSLWQRAHPGEPALQAGETTKARAA